MQLSMTVLRCPDQVAPEARTVSGGEFHVGRGPDVDWVLPDPDRLLSKRHFAVAFRGGGWQVADTSTNGTYLNTEPDSIGRGAARALRDGDRLRLGAYEIEVRLVDQPAQSEFNRAPAGGFGAGTGARSSQSPFGDPFADDPLAPAPAARRPFDEPAYRDLGVAPTSAQLPHDFDPLAPDHDDQGFGGGFRGPVQSDHSSSMDDAMIPPPIAGYSAPRQGGIIPGDDLLPDDWDKDLLEGISPPSQATTPAPQVHSPTTPASPIQAAHNQTPMPRGNSAMPPQPAFAPAESHPLSPMPMAPPVVNTPAAGAAPAAGFSEQDFADLLDPLAPTNDPRRQPATPAPAGSFPLDASPFGASPFETPHADMPPPGGAPPGGAPLGATPLGATPLGATPLGATPLGATPLGAAPLGATALEGTHLRAPQSAPPVRQDPLDFTDPLAPPMQAAAVVEPTPAPSLVAAPVVRQREPRPPTPRPAPSDADPFADLDARQELDPRPSAPPRSQPAPSQPAPSQPAPTRSASAAAPTASPFDEPADHPRSVPASAARPPNAAAPALAADDGGALAAFFKGADLSGAAPADPISMMTGLGQAFRALVAGLRQVLIARATIKGEFRIEQTMIRARGNNPLKFSANDDDALTALLGVGRRTDMAPAAAIEDSLRDLRLHELATMAAMQVAVRAMLDELSPDKIRAGSDQGGMAVLPAQRKARAWDAFETRHAAVVRALVDDFDSIFGKSFARAYERALDEISLRERQ